MSQSTHSVGVVNRSREPLGTVELEAQSTVLDLKKAIARSLCSKLKPARQRLTLTSAAGAHNAGRVLSDSESLGQSGLLISGEVALKDLGPQIGYATVYVAEYLGPMLIYPLFCLPSLQPYLYGTPSPFSLGLAQKLALVYWTLHYAKRIAETLLVHRFSKPTMPLFNLFRNCTYYFISAALVSYFINHPQYWAPNSPVVVGGFAAALVCQLGNLRCHLMLSRLRKPGDGSLAIPRGFLFDYITCPNYTCEMMGWFFFNVATQSLMGVLFMFAGASQMLPWATMRHKRLKKHFDGSENRPKYPKHRYAVLPPIL